MKEDNISQLDDYDVSFYEQQYTHGSCYISLFKFKSFDQFDTPQTTSNFRHLLNCGTIGRSALPACSTQLLALLPLNRSVDAVALCHN